MQQEELKQQKLDKLNRLLSEIPEHEAKSVALSIKNKMDLLKVCYDKSEPHHKAKIHELIEYTQLRCFLTGEEYSNTRIRSKEIKLKDVIYSVESIKGHIKKKQLPKESSWKAIDIYSFYFGGYRAFFRCFGKVYLEKKMELDKDFIEDVFSTKERDLYVSGEKLEIPGATIIDEEFINTVKTGKTFTMPEFYTAMQDKDCQWYGIINNYDVERDGYAELKDKIIDSFNGDRTFKISAVIYGDGGSGKSTFLRRLAVDFHNETFCTVWLKNSSAKEFIDYGLPIIENNQDRQFLIIIEDSYRMFKNNFELVSDLLNKAEEVSNVRIVIGDRNIEQDYRRHSNNDSEPLFLSANENHKIIKKIIEKYPDWKLASERLLENESKGSSQSRLFLLLFIIAHISQKEYENTSFNLSEPQTVFRNIIESDLEFIKKKYVGLAKALYYWSCIYAEYKGFITYKTLLFIGNYYNGNEEIIMLFSNLTNEDSKILNKLKLYIHINDEGFIQFNHDVLADIGLSKINFNDWEEFGSEVKLKLFEIITKHGDYKSSSSFLSITIQDHYKYKKDVNWLRPYITKQMQDDWDSERGSYFYMLHTVVFLDISLSSYIEVILNNNIKLYLVLEGFFLKFKVDEYLLSKILCLEKFNKVNLFAIQKVLEIYINNLNEKSSQIYSHSVNNLLPYKELFQRFFDKVLTKGADKLAPIFEIISFAGIEEDSIYNKINPISFIHSLKLSNNQSVIENFWNDFFLNEEWKIHSIIIEEYLSFNVPNTNKMKQKISNHILQNETWKEVNPHIIYMCLDFAMEEIKINFIHNILHNEDWKVHDNKIVSVCLDKATIDGRQEFSVKCLEGFDWLNYDCGVVNSCLHCFAGTNNIPHAIYNTIEFIIKNSNDPIINIYYHNILKWNFYYHSFWKEHTQNIIQNWKNVERTYVYKVLLSYRSRPEEIYTVCSNILIEWEQETNDYFFEKIISFALAHPDLRVLAKRTATEILQVFKEKKKIQHIERLHIIVFQIVENDIYPEWETGK